MDAGAGGPPGRACRQFLQPLDGNASDKRALLGAVQALTQQLRESGETAGVYAADSGLYSAENMAQLNATGCAGSVASPETSTEAQAIVQERLDPTKDGEEGWHSKPHGMRHWWSRLQPDLPQGAERWIVVRTQESEEWGARATVQRQAEREQATWEQRLWHLGNQPFACQPDTEAALAKTCQRLPPYFTLTSTLNAHPTYPTRGRPRKMPSPRWSGRSRRR